MKARGLNPKDFEENKTREVPVAKKELIEFLTFFAVDVYRTGGAAPATTVPAVDVEALRREHNPQPGDAPPAPTAIETGNAIHKALLDLPALFEAAPIKLQAELVVGFADRAAAG